MGVLKNSERRGLGILNCFLTALGTFHGIILLWGIAFKRLTRGEKQNL
jgi:hypothetical protein